MCVRGEVYICVSVLGVCEGRGVHMCGCIRCVWGGEVYMCVGVLGVWCV